MSLEIRASFAPHYFASEQRTLSVSFLITVNKIIAAVTESKNITPLNSIRFCYGGELFFYDLNEIVPVSFGEPRPHIHVILPRKPRPSKAGVKRPRSPDFDTEPPTRSTSHDSSVKIKLEDKIDKENSRV